MKKINRLIYSVVVLAMSGIAMFSNAYADTKVYGVKVYGVDGDSYLAVNNDGGLPVTVTNISDLMTDAPTEGDEVTLLMNSNLYTFDLTANPLQICYGYTSDYTAAIGDIIKAVWDGTKWIVELPIGSNDITTVGTITTGTWVSGHILASSLGTPPFTITNLSNPVQFEERTIYCDVANVTLNLASNVNIICYQRNQDLLLDVGDIVKLFYNGTKWIATLPPGVAYANYEAHTQNPQNTNENQVWACTVRGNDLGPEGALRVTFLCSATGTNGDKTVRVKFGGTTFFQVGTGATAAAKLQSMVIIRNQGATNVQKGYHSTNSNPYGTQSTALISGAIDTTVDQTLELTIQQASGTDTAFIESVIVEKIR